jgi:hypothetical protein
MRLPDVASRLRTLAIDLNCDELNNLSDEIPRRPPRQRGTHYLRPDNRCTKGANQGDESR